MLAPSTSGINTQQPWEYNRPRTSMIRESEMFGMDNKSQMLTTLVVGGIGILVGMHIKK